MKLYFIDPSATLFPLKQESYKDINSAGIEYNGIKPKIFTSKVPTILGEKLISHEIFTRVLPKLKRAELSFHYQCGSNGTEEYLLEKPCSMNVSLMENGTKNLLKNLISEDGKFDLTKPLVHDSIKIPAITTLSI